MGGDLKAMNRQMWTVLQRSGFVPGSPLRVDAFFIGRNERAARSLAASLQPAGWDVEVNRTKSQRWLFRTVTWSLEAHHTVDGVHLADLDGMVDHLDALATAHDCDFDGWGAAVPS